MTQVVESVATPSWVLFFRRHERRLAALWLAFTFCCVAGTLVRPVRVRVLTTMASLVDRWDGRWNRRLAAGVALYQRGDYEGAVTYLSRLDRIAGSYANALNGKTYDSAMPPQEAVLTDQQVADVLTYVFNTWGNDGEGGVGGEAAQYAHP